MVDHAGTETEADQGQRSVAMLTRQQNVSQMVANFGCTSHSNTPRVVDHTAHGQNAQGPGQSGNYA